MVLVLLSHMSRDALPPVCGIFVYLPIQRESKNKLFFNFILVAVVTFLRNFELVQVLQDSRPGVTTIPGKCTWVQDDDLEWGSYNNSWKYLRVQDKGQPSDAIKHPQSCTPQSCPAPLKDAPLHRPPVSAPGLFGQPGEDLHLSRRKVALQFFFIFFFILSIKLLLFFLAALSSSRRLVVDVSVCQS